MSTQADVEAAARRLVTLLDAGGTKDQDSYGTLDEAFRDLKIAIYTLNAPNYWQVEGRKWFER